MYLCYVDESGDPGLSGNGSRHLLLGAALLFEGKWTHAKAEINRLIDSYFPTAIKPQEIHCTDLRSGRGVFSKLPKPQRPAMLSDFCELASGMLDVELRLFTIIVDKPSWAARNPGKTGSDLYLEAFEDLVSRVDLFLRRRYAAGQPSKGIFIVDPHSSDLSAALKNALVGFQSSGTKWAGVYNLIESVMFLHSHESPGLQLADLCAYAIWRLVEYSDDSLAVRLASCFDREPLSAQVNPGKWHGVKYHGNDAAVATAIRKIWSH